MSTKRKASRIMALLLTLCMFFTLLPVPAFAIEYITSVKIEMDPPFDGETPNLDFDVLTKGVKGTHNGVWYNDTDGKWSSTDDFEAGKRYTFYAPIGPKSGYDLMFEMTATMNGKDANYGHYAYGVDFLENYVSMQFICPEEIDNVILYVTPPVHGKTPSTNYTLYPDAVIEEPGMDAYWYNKTDGYIMGSNDRFQAGKQYSFAMYVQPDEGYIWLPDINDVTLTTNGQSATLSYSAYGTRFCRRSLCLS